MSSILKEKIRKIFKGTKRLIGIKRGKMLQNEQKNRGESRILEAEKASGIEAWEFPRLHIYKSRCNGIFMISVINERNENLEWES